MESCDVDDVAERAKAYDFPIEQGAIRAFALSMQSDNPAYFGADAIVPPAFLINAWRWAPEGARAEHGIPRARLLHGEQEFEFIGDVPRAGDVLTVQEWVSDRFEKAGKRGGTMEFVVVTTEFRNAGEIVALMRSTFIGREAKATDA
ncbi:hypothetical protein GCM10010461_17590 [Microbacterium aurantiacum]